MKDINNIPSSTQTMQSEPNKVLDSIKQVQSFKEVISSEDMEKVDISRFSLLKKNVLDKKLKVEKNDKWEYRISRINYERSMITWDDLKNSLTKAAQCDGAWDQRIEQINKFLDQDLEVVKYHFNDKSLHNRFLRLTQRVTQDFNHNVINFSDEDGSIESVANQVKREVYLPKWDIEKYNLPLPEEKEVEVSALQLIQPQIKEFIIECDPSAVELELDDIHECIVSKGSNIQWGVERIKEFMQDSSLSSTDRINKLKDEYGTWGWTIEISGIQWMEEHSAGLGIMYSMDNGQVFPFSWKKVHDIYDSIYNTQKEVSEAKEVQKTPTVSIDKVDEVSEPVKKEQKAVLLQWNKQLGIFNQWVFEPTPVEKSEFEKDIEKELEALDEYKEETYIDLKKKVRFGMIESNSMGRFVLNTQPETDSIDEFKLNCMNSIREKVNKNSIFTASIPELKCLYEIYNLEDLDGKETEFENIFNSMSYNYIKWAFQMRISKIAKRMNEYDNPEQSLEEFYHNVRTAKFDFSTMDIERYKKVVSGISVLYNHDLMTLPKNEIKRVIKDINAFMRPAKQYIIDNKLEFSEIDSVLQPGFLKNYKSALG